MRAMRNAGAALAAALLLLVPARARSASAEPELVRMEPSAPRKRAAVPALPPAKPKESAPPREAAPRLERDELREKIRTGKPKRPFFTARTFAWFARSSVDTRYAIQIPSSLVTPVGLEVFYGETQERTAEGMMLVHGAELAPLDWFSVEGEFGEDRQTGGMTDHFWINSPNAALLTNLSNGATWTHPDHEDDTVQRRDHAARRDWLAANAMFRVMDGRVFGAEEWEVSHALDVMIGAHRFRQDGRFSNLRTTTSLGKFFTQQALGPIAGENGTYRAQWRGVHFGMREEMAVPMGFAFDGMVLWSPFMEYRGDGYDNLLVGPGNLRGETPNYEDRSHGSALHFRLGASWTWSVMRLEAGYMRLYFSSHRGNRRYNLYGGGGFDRGLEMTETEVSGLYAGGAVRF